MLIVSTAVAAALAVWLWTGPDLATTRLARLAAAPGSTPGVRRRLGNVIRPRPSKRAEAWRTASLDLCQGLCAELAAGLPPGEALARAVEAVDFPDDDLPRLLTAAARDGGDVARTLVEAAPAQGGEGFRQLAACWDVSTSVGAGLSPLVERVVAALRAARAHRQDLAAQLAGPRATARMLAVLPLLGIGMAAALGMNPLGFLFGSVPGIGCLAVGVALDVCGLWWTHRMAVRAESG
ncbi:type II secretion system F family protein [Thermoactinospora rubra]|uniref:type II secretion system F family protein n=1 Tax=Thermoactinospora rubra TaxID=1088767 RepID=UPI000A1133FF|nr:type II secretion system F family protein [Thermoactinospora rubra]